MEHVELIWKILEDDPTLKSGTITAPDSFVRVSIVKDDVILKLDFVNDINYHIGDIHSSDLFHKIDSLENILTNINLSIWPFGPERIFGRLLKIFSGFRKGTLKITRLAQNTRNSKGFGDFWSAKQSPKTPKHHEFKEFCLANT